MLIYINRYISAEVERRGQIFFTEKFQLIQAQGMRGARNLSVTTKT